MADKLISITPPPGFRKTGTVYQSKGRWYTGNLVRFFQDTIRPLGGWATRTLTGATITGLPRAAISYRLNDGVQVIVVGTSTGLFVIKANVVTDITPSEFSGYSLNVSDPPTWQLDTFGAYLVGVFHQPDSDSSGAAFYWSGDTATTGELILPFNGTDPVSAVSVVATPERFLVMLGAVYTASGWSTTGQVPLKRVVTWATQEGGFTGSDWVPSATNTAGDFTLSTNGDIVAGLRGKGNTLIWTTTDLWAMTYIGGQFVYRFDQVGNHCGLIGTNAAIVTDSGAFWMGYNGFFRSDGTFVTPLDCDVHDAVFNDINRTWAHTAWAIENAAFGEITWFYPNGAVTEEAGAPGPTGDYDVPNKYVTYNYRENHWVTGTLTRACGIPDQPGVTPYPVMFGKHASTAGRWVLKDHETGSGRESEGTPSLESGPMEIGDGDEIMSLQRVIPDDNTVGDVNLTIYTAPNPDTAETTNGPYTLTAHTTLRLKARQIRVKLTEAVAASWRVGVIRLGVRPSGRRG